MQKWLRKVSSEKSHQLFRVKELTYSLLFCLDSTIMCGPAKVCGMVFCCGAQRLQGLSERSKALRWTPAEPITPCPRAAPRCVFWDGGTAKAVWVLFAGLGPCEKVEWERMRGGKNGLGLFSITAGQLVQFYTWMTDRWAAIMGSFERQVPECVGRKFHTERGVKTYSARRSNCFSGLRECNKFFLAWLT